MDTYMDECLSIVVIGASGDLAKKKTYPSLFALFQGGFVKDVLIIGYARTKMSNDEFREKMQTALKGKGKEADIEDFLKMCIYTPGLYGDVETMQKTVAEIEKYEASATSKRHNRLYYFAIPPNVFANTGHAIKEVGMATSGWTRVIIEKPFGKDLNSFEDLSAEISSLFPERMIYRIDHYLGKEMIQNLATLRFANGLFEPIWNYNHVSSVTITFKENFGTDGRGGYFDQYGIVRDVMQNHLMQVLCLFAMEAPPQFSGADEQIADFIRNEKVKVIHAMQPIREDEVVLGQYTGNADGAVGYTDDKTVPDDSTTPTFAAVVLRVSNPRWEGVPFILRAGKALNERKSEIRLQLKPPPAFKFMFGVDSVAPNELVMRLQPEEAIYMKTNVKRPGLTQELVVSELDLSYKSRFREDFKQLPDAYTRLLLDTFRGDKSSFVREDELRESWRIFTPLLERIDAKAIPLVPYEYGTRGPAEADDLIQRVGFNYSGDYHWNKL